MSAARLPERAPAIACQRELCLSLGAPFGDVIETPHFVLKADAKCLRFIIRQPACNRMEAQFGQCCGGQVAPR